MSSVTPATSQVEHMATVMDITNKKTFDSDSVGQHSLPGIGVFS